MNLKKMNSLLQFGIRFPNIISEEGFIPITGQKLSDTEWDILIRYTEGIDALSSDYNFTYQSIGTDYALIRIQKNEVGALSDEKQIVYLEFPMVMNYILDKTSFDLCITPKTTTPQGFGLSGDGVLIGTIDSGIDYRHLDFRNEDGSTRLVSLWDQGQYNQIYSREQINAALEEESIEEAFKIVPERDELGHGTAMAGISAGNGRASNGKYIGIAPKADLIVVKVNNPNLKGIDATIRARNVDIMLGIEYVLQQAKIREQPLSLLIGFGLNEGTHDGKNSLERYIDMTSIVWRNNIVVGTGNQANKDNHIEGVLKEGEEKEISIFIDEGQPYYLLVLVKNYTDTFGIQIIAPTGEATEVLTSRIPNRGYVLSTTGVMINFSGPDANTSTQQITVLLEKFEAEAITPGTWTLKISGKEIIFGTYDAWASSLDPFQRSTFFLNPNPLKTITIPATAERITSVGAYDEATYQILPFSGRGYTLDNRIKPDIVAPGKSIIAPTSLEENGYATVTGTSAAAAFMTGGYALLLEYGVREKPNNYIYGEELKANVTKYASRPVQYEPYPNEVWGYGRLCINQVLDALKEIYEI